MLYLGNFSSLALMRFRDSNGPSYASAAVSKTPNW